MARPKSEGGDPSLGLRIATLRKLKGLSQKQLGDAIGVSFQQVQKYEKGTNRVAADRLSGIAAFLNVPVGQLVGTETGALAETTSIERLAIPGAPELLVAYSDITDPSVRAVVLAGVIAAAQTAARMEAKRVIPPAEAA